MDFAVPERARPILAAITRFVDEEVIACEPAFLTGDFGALEAELEILRAKVKALGLWAPQSPPDIGGMGLSLLEHALVSEALGRSPLGHYVFGCQAPDAGNLEILHRHGTAAQKERWLLPLAAGEIRSCFSMTEPDSPGSNPTQLVTRADLDDTTWVVNGRKWFTSSADGAAFAIVMAVTDPDAPPHRRASMIIVPTDTPGFKRVRNIPVVGHAGDGYQSHAEITYESCRVPHENLLGGRGEGFNIAQERLGPGRIHHCMRWLGICARAFELMCRRALGRQIDAEDRLADKQIVQAWIAESRAAINASRLLVLDAAWRIDTGGWRSAQEEISLIKFHVAGVMLEVVDRAIQIHGAYGLTDATPLAFWYAQERGARIYDGPDEVHKVSAARRILKKIGA